MKLLPQYVTIEMSLADAKTVRDYINDISVVDKEHSMFKKRVLDALVLEQEAPVVTQRTGGVKVTDN